MANAGEGMTVPSGESGEVSIDMTPLGQRLKASEGVSCADVWESPG